VRQHVASLAKTEAFKKSARARRKVDMCFAHLKRHLNFRRLRLRMTGARDECTLAAIAQSPQARQDDRLLAAAVGSRLCVVRNEVMVRDVMDRSFAPLTRFGQPKREPRTASPARRGDSALIAASSTPDFFTEIQDLYKKRANEPAQQSCLTLKKAALDSLAPSIT
jgi:hypothetical protein